MNKPTKYKIGDLWIIKKLPPLLFIYTPHDGWILAQGSLLSQLWLINSRKRIIAKYPQLGAIIESDKSPPNARRYV